jgi:hypothetical protein
MASGGVGACLVSPCNVEWACFARAGGVEESEESEFCLFLMFFPVRCISSVSPRFYFRKHAFCFLPLVTIFQGFCLIFFSEVFHIVAKFLFHILCSLLYFIYLFFYRFLCFTLEFVESFLSSFRCFCVYSSFLLVVSWYFLCASCAFWLTVSWASPWVSQWSSP